MRWLLSLLFVPVSGPGASAAGDAFWLSDPSSAPTLGCMAGDGDRERPSLIQTGRSVFVQQASTIGGHEYVAWETPSSPERYFPKDPGAAGLLSIASFPGADRKDTHGSIPSASSALSQRSASLGEIREHPKAESSAHSHGDSEHVEPQGHELAVGGMLLGTVVFIMVMFYALNHPDPQMKCYSWEILSKTIAIFVAVLVFEGYNGIFTDIIRTKLRVNVQTQHAVIFVWGALQIFIWIFGCRLVVRTFRRTWASEEDGEDFPTGHLSRWQFGPLACPPATTECRFKAWVDLSAHMAAFAAIRTGRNLQHVPFFLERSVVFALIPVIVLAGLMSLSFSLLSSCAPHSDCTDSHDTQTDVVKVDEEGEEAENEIFGLSLSNLTAQVVIIFINAVEGHHHSEHVLTWGGVLTAYAVALSCLGLTVMMVYNKQGIAAEVDTPAPVEGAEALEEATRHILHLKDLRKHRFFFVTQMTLAMCASWLILDATGHTLMWCIGNDEWSHHSTTFNVLKAVVVSFTAFTAVWALDKLNDLDSYGDSADKGLVCIIHALAILIGFSWEQAFHASFLNTQAIVPESFGWLLPIAGALGISFVVVPAWRAYILRRVLAIEEEEHQAEMSRKAAREEIGAQRGLRRARHELRSGQAALSS